MNRRLILVCALSGACNSTFLTDLEPEVRAAPILDLGTIVLGTETSGHVGLTVKNGTASVLDVNLLPMLGAGFLYEGDLSFVLDADLADGLDVIFRPVEEGYASAQIQVTTDGKPPVVEVEVRARAVAASVFASPSIVDFGQVPAGEGRARTVRLENFGNLEVVLTGAVGGPAGLTVDAVFPLTLDAGADVELPLVYTAPSVAPMLASLELRVGSAAVPNPLIVRANSCASGLPGAYDLDQDGVTSCGGDCDDGDADIGPGRPESANGVDDDCDRLIDEGTTPYDNDGDGYCAASTCLGAALPGDCHDGDGAVSPGAREVDGNGVDDDCDGRIDLGAVDGDDDGFGPAGGDCDDGDAAVRPGAPERVNDVDDDCDGAVDEGTAVYDDDGDGWCESATVCVDGALPGDCSDAAVLRSPGAVERADGVDNNCDGRVDEGTSGGDDDGDGFTEAGGDCDDADPDVSPARGGCP